MTRDEQERLLWMPENEWREIIRLWRQRQRKR